MLLREATEIITANFEICNDMLNAKIDNRWWLKIGKDEKNFYEHSVLD